MKIMTRKRLFIFIVILIIFILGILYRIINLNEKQEKNNNVKIYTEDSLKFKSEYEALNNVKDENGENKYININIDESLSVKYLNIQEVLELLDSGTGIIYFGMPECPWCRNMLPVLFDIVKQKGINKIYYYNPKEIREQNTNEYQQLILKLGDYLKVDTTTQKETDANFDNSKKRLYMPDVFFVKAGKIVGNNRGTVEEQKDPKIGLTDEQRKKLSDIFSGLIDKIDTTCDGNNNFCE